MCVGGCVWAGAVLGFECAIVDDFDLSALHILLSFGKSPVGRLQNQ